MEIDESQGPGSTANGGSLAGGSASAAGSAANGGALAGGAGGGATARGGAAKAAKKPAAKAAKMPDPPKLVFAGAAVPDAVTRSTLLGTWLCVHCKFGRVAASRSLGVLALLAHGEAGEQAPAQNHRRVQLQRGVRQDHDHYQPLQHHVPRAGVEGLARRRGPAVQPHILHVPAAR